MFNSYKNKLTENSHKSVANQLMSFSHKLLLIKNTFLIAGMDQQSLITFNTMITKKEERDPLIRYLKFFDLDFRYEILPFLFRYVYKILFLYHGVM